MRTQSDSTAIGMAAVRLYEIQSLGVVGVDAEVFYDTQQTEQG